MEKTQEKLKARAVSLEEDIATLIDPDFPVDCFCDPTTGNWDHNERCYDASSHFPSYRCPEEEFDNIESRIDRIRLRDLLRLCFEGPRNAEGQRTLQDGMVQDSPIYRIS